MYFCFTGFASLLKHHGIVLQGLLMQQGSGNGSSNGGGSGQEEPAEKQDFPEKRKHMFCYKAPSDSLLIQARQTLTIYNDACTIWKRDAAWHPTLSFLCERPAKEQAARLDWG